MKKLFTVTALIMALVLTGCGEDPAGDNNGSNNNNSDVIGTWKTADGTLTLEISDDTFTFFGSWSGSCSWSKNGNVLQLLDRYHQRLGTATLSSGTLVVLIESTQNTSLVEGTYELSRNSSPNTGGDGKTTLKISNQSFSDLTDVQWNGITFGNVDIGKSVTKTVSEGSGYIFFTRATNPIVARTSEFTVVEKDQENTFTFHDNTLVIEKDDPDNAGTLGSLAAKVKAPQGLTVTPGDGSIYAEWQAVAGATEYRVYCSTDQNPPAEPVITVQNETNALINGLPNGTLHYVWVKSANTRNESPFSNRASCTPIELATTLSWSGNWTRNSQYSYTSNAIGNNASTWETLTITTSGGCSLIVLLTASSATSTYYGGDYGYATKLDAPQSPSNYQLRVIGTSSGTYTYTIPAGTHTIHFGYVKDDDYADINDNVTVSVSVQ